MPRRFTGVSRRRMRASNLYPFTQSLYLDGVRRRSAPPFDLWQGDGERLFHVSYGRAKEFMEAGGIQHKRERVFLLSLTYGAETHCLAAALATMQSLRRAAGNRAPASPGASAWPGREPGGAGQPPGGLFWRDGRPCNSDILHARREPRHASQPFRTLFLQEIIKRGIIGPSFVVSYSHTDHDIDQTIDAVAAALQVYARALDAGRREVSDRPVGQARHATVLLGGPATPAQ